MNQSIRQTALYVLWAASLILGGCASEPEHPQAEAGSKPPPKISVEAQAIYDSALSAMKSGQDQQAITLFKTFTQRYPSLAGAYVNLGLLYLQQDKPEQAVEALAQAIKLNPANTTAHNQLGVAYRNLGRFKEAEQAYLAALAIDKNYANAHLNLGILYDLYQGKLSQALKHYKQYQSLTGGENKLVAKWIIDVERRNTARNKQGAQKG